MSGFGDMGYGGGYGGEHHGADGSGAGPSASDTCHGAVAAYESAIRDFADTASDWVTGGTATWGDVHDAAAGAVWAHDSADTACGWGE